jgi:hypothetical protein
MTQDYKPDFRALCAELADAFEQHVEDVIDAGCGWMELKTEKLLARARAALAQPELQGPTDQEITEWADAAPGVPQEALDPEFCGWRRCFGEKEFADTIRAALAHWA